MWFGRCGGGGESLLKNCPSIKKETKHFLYTLGYTFHISPKSKGFRRALLWPEWYGGTSKCCYACVMVGLSVAVISSLHNNLHLLKMEDKIL